MVAYNRGTYVFMVLWIMAGNFGVLNLLTAIFYEKLDDAKAERKEEEGREEFKEKVKATSRILDVFRELDKVTVAFHLLTRTLTRIPTARTAAASSQSRS